MLITDDKITTLVDRHEDFRVVSGAIVGEWVSHVRRTRLEQLYILRSSGSKYPAFIYSPDFDKWWENSSPPGFSCTTHKEKLRPSNITPEVVTPQQMHKLFHKGLKGTVVSVLMWGE